MVCNAGQHQGKLDDGGGVRLLTRSSLRPIYRTDRWSWAYVTGEAEGVRLPLPEYKGGSSATTMENAYGCDDIPEASILVFEHSKTD